MREDLLTTICWNLPENSTGYTICKYINWVGMHRKIGDKNNYRKYLHMYLSKAQFYNLSRFRLGAWKLNVNNINLEHIGFECPEYNSCRLKYHE